MTASSTPDNSPQPTVPGPPTGPAASTPVSAPLRAADFARSPDEVAPLLVGSTLRRGRVAVVLTEVEAYLGDLDPASHAHRGPTPRCRTMFGPPLHLYVYASYGIHRAGNIVCWPSGRGGGVLLRAGRVVEGVDDVRLRRGWREVPGEPEGRPVAVNLARGPGNLGAALGLDLDLDGSPVALGTHATGTDGTGAGGAGAGGAGADDGFTLIPRTGDVEVVSGPRIGISRNREAPLRFWIPGDPTVTTPRGRPRR
ncbi:DNA-3-methyladenine glycosylase [Corynebacterium bovis]|uniref:Putative 3-methyladenine DNA glycosylase n=1 Tax=Corynebacterium bovis DSM 20582 = CIP 54.80 TaxID=927655 RepID=A0A8H9Y797_9CORY|nr:DNA-3-methyladenine glycosylase [Corynebacterium bovis]MBB3116089.1 DNA-3-methyladenine glycosylase [Corynebacterium bovis DSM 20582 = CIP 54.80]QQC47024.1 DNA-3-methyladenine glycosylase [Corynebacterium bovis]RRQ14045.1 DNA-3-methyladenine glycosylase [Corynebacterium bovis]RRQ15161.1 DNA-3-methyladenine glycosylase [Corynebacterium bovis]WJY76675.1 3-methyladenine DNA glycosylase [Corynebacterium bovis DSM 20582 = CIP 54.80]